eukprot:SAG31_NODE_1973_length_6757_cov_1.653950_8_plen_154_part_00
MDVCVPTVLPFSDVHFNHLPNANRLIANDSSSLTACSDYSHMMCRAFLLMMVLCVTAAASKPPSLIQRLVLTRNLFPLLQLSGSILIAAHVNVDSQHRAEGGGFAHQGYVQLYRTAVHYLRVGSVQYRQTHYRRIPTTAVHEHVPATKFSSVR